MYASTAEVVRVLVQAGCPLHARDAPPLSQGPIDHAAQNGHRDVLFALVGEGADINARDESGMTPLLQYCSSLNVRGDMVRALIEAVADIHATWFRGRTALHEAGQLFGGDRCGKLRDVIIALVEAGLDVNVRDDSFSTPLHYAVGEEGLDLGAVQTLLELGADPALKNDCGQTPLDLAPDHVRIWKRIAAEGRPGVFAGLATPENMSSIAHLIKGEKSGRVKALEEAEEALRLLSSHQHRR
jgi:ankyrin repeat protein